MRGVPENVTPTVRGALRFAVAVTVSTPAVVGRPDGVGVGLGNVAVAAALLASTPAAINNTDTPVCMTTLRRFTPTPPGDTTCNTSHSRNK